MNKSELIDAVAASADLPKASAGRAIDAMIDTITGSLQKDDPVVLVLSLIHISEPTRPY